MPLPLETAVYLVPLKSLIKLEIGGRIASSSKDVLLPMNEIVLPWLSDRFFLPFSHFVFSFGDVLIAEGAFWLLFKSAQPAKAFKEESHA